MRKTIIEPVRAGRCLAPLVIYPPGRPFQSMTLCGLIDTGANQSAIDARIAEALGLPAVGQRLVSPASGQPVSCPSYGATIEFWLQGFGADALPRTVELSTLVHPMAGGTMLIGMDILKAGEFGLHASGIWDFTY